MKSTKLFLLAVLIFSSFFGRAQEVELSQVLHTQSTLQQGYLGGGQSVDFDGDRVIYGSPGHQNDAGAVYIYKRSSTGDWVEEQVLVPATTAFQEFGRAVTIEGNHAVVYAKYTEVYSDNLGAIYFYTFNGTEWALTKTVEYPRYNTSGLSLSNGRLAFGMNGKVHIFDNVAGNWVNTETINAPIDAGLSFGAHLGFDGNTIAISAHEALDASNVNVGAVYVYNYVNNAWVFEQKISSPLSTQSAFGLGIDISGDNIAVAATHAPYAGFNFGGLAYIYNRANGVWSLDTELFPDNPSAIHYFGYAISISGSNVLVSHYEDKADAQLYRKENGVWNKYIVKSEPGQTLANGAAIKGKEMFIGSRYIYTDGSHKKVGGVYYFRDVCSVEDLVVNDINCTGDNVTFNVSYTSDWDTPFEVYDATTGAILSTGMSPISASIPSSTEAVTMEIGVRRVADTDCFSTVSVEMPACNGDCDITGLVYYGLCNNNGTPDDASDDYTYINFKATNTSSTATHYTAELLGQTYGPYAYGTGGHINNIPSDFSYHEMVFRDVDSPNCTFNRTIHSIPCSGCNGMPVHISSNGPVCVGEDIILLEDGNYANTWQWSGPNGFSFIGSENVSIPAATLADSGTYSVTITNAIGCILDTSIYVQVMEPNMPIDAGTYEDVCLNQGLVSLVGSPNGGIFSVDGITTNLIDPSIVGVGVHTIEYLVHNVCTDTDELATSKITVMPVGPPPVVEDITVCEGENTTITPAYTTPERVNIYVENFLEEGVGVTGPGPVYTPPTNGAWMLYGNFSKLNTQNRYFKVLNSNMVAKTTRKLICFETEPIDISGKEDVRFSVDIFEDSDLEPKDFADVFYIVDGQVAKIVNWNGQGNYVHTLTGKNGANDDDWGFETVTQSGLSGNSLIIKICMKDNASDESISFDNLVVDYQPTEAPYYFYDADPLAENTNLLAGPATSFDPQTTPTTSPQTIWVTSMSGNGCQSDASPVVVTVKGLQAYIAGESQICEGESVALSVVTQGTSWQWTGPNGFTASTQSINITNTTTANAGTYQVSVTLDECSVEASFDVVVSQPPMITANDINVCEGNSTLIEPTKIGYSPIVFAEYFDEEEVGYQGPGPVYTPPSNGQWSMTGQNLYKMKKSNQYMKVVDGVMTGRRTKAKMKYLTQEIDISNYDAVNFSVDIAQAGNLETADFVNVFYIVDGVSTQIIDWEGQGTPWKTLNGGPGPDWGSTVVYVNDISGSTLQIEIHVRNSSMQEYMFVDNLIITDAAPTVPQFYFYDANPITGTANILSGPAPTYDPGTTVETSPQQVWITGAIEEGCNGEAIPVTVNVSPFIELSVEDVTVCEGDGLALNATTNFPNGTYEWTGPNGYVSDGLTLTIPQTNMADAGNYHIASIGTNEACAGQASGVVTIKKKIMQPFVQDLNEAPYVITPTAFGSSLSIFEEQFNEEGAGVTGPTPVSYTPPSNGQWSIFGNINKLKKHNQYAKVKNGHFVARRLKTEIGFETSEIDISNMDAVNFSIDIWDVGDLEPSDYVDIYYEVDGVTTFVPNWQGQGSNAHTLTGKNGANDDDWGFANINIEGITGNTLIVGWLVKDNAGTERIVFDHLVVSATETNFMFYDSDPALGNANLLAGPASSYLPEVTAENSPQTYWVATYGGIMCNSVAVPVTLTVPPVGEAIIEANKTIFCEGETLVLSEVSGNANSWAWSGPSGFSSTGQTVNVGPLVPENAGQYTVVISNASGGTATASIDIVVHPASGEVPCFKLVSPDEGFTFDFSPELYNFYDGDPLLETSTLIESQTSVISIDTNMTNLWITTGLPDQCESLPQEIIINDTALYNLIGFGAPHLYTAGDDSVKTIWRLAWPVLRESTIELYGSVNDALLDTNNLTVPFSVNDYNIVYYRFGDPECPTIGMATVIDLSALVGSDSGPDDALNDNSEFEFKADLDLERDLILFQNRPNPFSNETVISFSLPSEELVVLTVYDMNGSKVYGLKNTYPKGMNQVLLSRSNLKTNGVLYYRIQTSTQSALGKMIMLD